MAFVKFQGRTQTDGNGDLPLFWGRSDLDNAPYRGPKLPLLKEEEAEQLLERAYDPFCGTFDTSRPQQQHHGHTLQAVLDGAVNGWYKIMSWQEKWYEPPDSPPVMFVFVVWTIPYMQPSPAALQHSTNFLPFGSR